VASGSGDENRTLTHFDEDGAARMVDVSGKEESVRQAVAEGSVHMLPSTLGLILDRALSKGDVLAVARLAGIMAAKKTADLIPLCHSLNLSSVEVSFMPDREASRIQIKTVVTTTGPTGVEMEALTAAAVAGLAIYDMCKAVDREMTINGVHLVKKTGGRSGTFERKI
jgi:cyclic pyranopterin monophosphate synthase